MPKLIVPGAIIDFEIIYQKRAVDKIFPDKPVLFILPGGPGFDSSYYKGHSDILPEMQIVYFDPRGCGQSSIDDITSWEIINYIEDIEALRQYLCPAIKINLFGKSFGSMIGGLYATRYSDHIDKLVLAAGSPSSDFIREAKKILEQKGTAEQQEVCEWLFSGKLNHDDRLTTFFHRTASLYSVTAKKSAGSKKTTNIKSGNCFSGAICDMGFPKIIGEDNSGIGSGFNYINQLKNITCETLILSGMHDWINPPSQQAIFAREIPHSHLVMFQHSGHAFSEDEPKKYQETLQRFFQTDK